MKKPSLLAAIVLALGAASLNAAEARLAQIFQDNMVLQQNAPVPVWGWAGPGTKVTVRFAGQQAEAQADTDGYWKAVLSPLVASSEGRSLEARIGGTTVTRANVVVGEVWLAAGQSNMNHAGPDRASGYYPRDVLTAPGRPDVRITRHGDGASLRPLNEVDPVFRRDAPWVILRGDAVIESLDLPTAFARLLRDRLDVPIGIVHVSVSGTNQGAWMSRETLEEFPGSGKFGDYYQERLAGHAADLAEKGKTVKSWADFERAMEVWRKNPRGRSPANSAIVNFPTALYNTRVHPLAPFALQGVIWHQGEAGPGGPYGSRLAAMARQWREHFGQDLFFIWGTLTRDTSASPRIAPQPTWFYRSSTNDEIRKAREAFGGDPRTALVELYDVGDHETHFLQKNEAGRRYALAALSGAYGKDDVFSGPILTDAKIMGDKAVVRFERVGEGLVFQSSLDGISGFYVKGKTGEYRWATVTVTSRDAIEISHPDVSEIAAIGYAVNDNPHETLFNSAGFPASPFKLHMDRIPWSGQAKGMPLVALENSAAAKTTVSVTHVRRGGYAFQLLAKRGAPQGGAVKLRAWLPAEWRAWIVESDNARIEARKETVEGRSFATFAAPVDGAWIIVAEKGRAEEFRKIDRY